MKVNETHNSVFFQLYNNPIEAALLTLKSDLIIIAVEKIKSDKITMLTDVNPKSIDMLKRVQPSM